MIKLFFIFSLLTSIAYMREKDPHPFITEASSPVAELYAANNDHDQDKFDYLMFISKRVKAIVEGPYVQIQSIYTYKNTMDHIVAAEFEFPQIETDISHRVEIRYQDTTMRVIFDEANSPNKEYSKKSPYTKERFSYREIQAGNVQANDTVEVTFTVMRSLKIKLNQFYELSINPYYEPRFETLNRVFIKRNYNIQVELRSAWPFTILANPTHQLKPVRSRHTDFYKAFYNITMENIFWFAEDFKIYFASTDFNAPQKIMATHSFNPHDHAFMFNLIPDMKYLDLWSWEGQYLRNLSDSDNLSELKNVTRQSELRYFPKEYLFVIDRSNSMEESHIEDLKKTLNKILDTFSYRGSFYSFLSFGSSTQLHWKKSNDYRSPEEIAEIRKWVETIEGDMGEKDLLGALKFAFEKYQWSKLPKNVIILTDGEVSNTDEIIQLVQANSHAHKICAIGDIKEKGDILRKIGTAGGCPIEMPWWSVYSHDRFLDVFDATFTPPAFNLAYEITCENRQNATVHQEEGVFDGIRKDEAFIKWVTLKNIPNLKSCRAKVFYYSQHRCSSSFEEIEIFRAEKAQFTDIWHKVAEHSKLRFEPQIDDLKRKLIVNNHLQEEEAAVGPFECQEVNQEDFVSIDEPQQERSQCEVYQEKFNNLLCTDPKKQVLLNGLALGRPFFEWEQDELHYESSSPKIEEPEKESFSTNDTEREYDSFFLFQTICFAMVFLLSFVAACKIVLK